MSGELNSFELTQPDVFFPWLAGFVSDSEFSCQRVTFRVDGLLLFVFRHGGGEIRIGWSVARSLGQGLPFRDGSVVVLGRAAPGTAVREHLIERLNALFAVSRPPLLEKRNREMKSIRFEPEVLSRLTARFFVEGKTRCGPYTFSRSGSRGGRFSLEFSSADGELRFQLAPGGKAGGLQRLVDVGPFVLEMAELPTDPEARRVAGFVGYVLRLCFHEDLTIDRSGGGGQVPSPSAGDTFLSEEFTDEPCVFDALFLATSKVIFVGNLERECLQCFAYFNGPTERLSASTWKVRPGPAFGRELRFVDRSDQDMVMGSGEECLAGLMREAAQRGDPDLLVVMDSCLARLVGDATEALVSEMQPDLGVPVIYLDGSVATLLNYPILWRRLVEIFVESRERSPRPSVNLIGFGHRYTRSLEELRALLDAVGVDVNACVMPAFDREALARLDAAWLNVVCPSRLARHGFSEMAAIVKAPTIMPPAPCGFRETRNWLNAILEGCGLNPVTGTQVDALQADAAERWQELQQRAGRYRVAVVLELEGSNHGLPRLRWGLPWLEVLEEMGFQLEIMVRRQPDDGRAKDREVGDAGAVVSWLQDPERHRLRGVPAETELPRLLGDGDFRLIYTERFRDRRVTTAGKMPFSAADFELGLAGSVRTLSRLLDLCEVSFYHRYREHLRSGGRLA